MKVIYPLPKSTVVQGFGVDNSGHKTLGGFYTLFDNKHPGVDFKIQPGERIRCALPGIVVRREFHQGMGNVIGTRIGNIVVLYAHLTSFSHELGDVVDYNDEIGLSGNTGEATTGPHLHFEMRDISKSPLKAMVFDPPFGKILSNYTEKFSYTVKNENTPKSLAYLSRMYFGSEIYIEKIRILNKFDFSDDEILPDKLTVIIPNYF